RAGCGLNGSARGPWPVYPALATWEDIDKLSDDDAEEEEANLALMASADSDVDSDPEPESDSEATEE
ncbi:hypothetical protein A2U01_0113858, partial [Trifolium medium]|nr:hypothetical protein [Trifolium medium]